MIYVTQGTVDNIDIDLQRSLLCAIPSPSPNAIPAFLTIETKPFSKKSLKIQRRHICPGSVSHNMQEDIAGIKEDGSEEV